MFILLKYFSRPSKRFERKNLLQTKYPPTDYQCKTYLGSYVNRAVLRPYCLVIEFTLLSTRSVLSTAPYG